MDEWKLYRLVTWFPRQVTRPISLFVQRQPEAGAVFLDWCLRSRQKWEVVFGDMCPQRHMVPWRLNGLAYRLTCVSVPRRAKMWQAVQGHNMEPSWEKFGTLCVQFSTPNRSHCSNEQAGMTKTGMTKTQIVSACCYKQKIFLRLTSCCYKPKKLCF